MSEEIKDIETQDHIVSALALVGIAVEHLHGKQVVGRGADVGVKNNKGNTGVLLAAGRIRGRIVIVATSRKYEAHADGG